MTEKKSRLLGRAVLLEQGEHRALIAEVAIDCPDCGQFVVRFAGHHLRALRNLLTEWVDEFPDLCGNEAGLEVLRRETERFSGGGGDPNNN